MKYLNNDQESKKKLIATKSNEELKQGSDNILNYLNSQNIKIFATFIVVLFVIYHGYLNSQYGRNSCNRLLGEGHILGNNDWQPVGCMIHNYKEDDINTCFKYTKFYNVANRFYFIGDFRIRQVYTTFVQQLDPSYSIKNDALSSNQNASYLKEVMNLEVNYIHKPIIDESLYNLVEALLSIENKKPSFLVMGMGIEYLLMNTSSKEEILEGFKGNLTNLVDMINSAQINSESSKDASANLMKNTQSKRALKERSTYSPTDSKTTIQPSPDTLNKSPVYWMLQDPIDENKLFSSNNKTLYEQLTNQQIDTYNRAALNIIQQSTVSIWSSSRLVSQGFNTEALDGIQIGYTPLKINSQILFNLYCNNRLNFNDATCCSQPEPLSVSQNIIFFLFVFSSILAALLCIYKKFFSNHSNKFRFNLSGSEIVFTSASCKNATASVGIYTTLSSFAKLSLVILYFYGCDRANYFMKENQHYTLFTFLIPLIYVSVVGLFFHDSLNAPKVMNRHQTDEIKGFMQCVILIYKISAASASVPLYFLIRLMSSSYLFMSGYGHFMYYYNTANYGIIRFFQVLFRLNFLSIILCFSMNRMYQFYTFIPLVTFWFVCAYIVMAMFPRISVHLARENPFRMVYIFIKLCVFLGFAIALSTSQTLFEQVFMFKLWKYLFVNTDDLVSEWRDRWNLDAYSFLIGMFFGLLISALKAFNIIDNSDDDQIELEESSTELRDKKREKNLPTYIKLFFILTSVTGLVSYGVFANLCQSKEGCNQYIAYITVIPIISFIILRNTIDFLSDKCSLFFRWIGKISLELYVSSYHIWLAADSNGILVLLPGYPVLNVLVVTFIFVCIAHELNKITKVLSQYFVPNNWRICLRNFFSFLMILLPIAIKYGYV